MYRLSGDEVEDSKVLWQLGKMAYTAGGGQGTFDAVINLVR